MKIDQLTLSFKDLKQIEIAELGHFLFLFRGAYAAALPIVRSDTVRRILADSDSFQSRLVSTLHKLDVTAVDKLFSKNLGKNASFTRSIVHRNPLEIILAGVASALVLAVILSGGRINIDLKSGKIEADLPPIADGIQKLREVLTKAPKAPLAYGVKPKKIKLSTQEFDELMKFDPATKRRGGFQRLLIGMQVRINRVTRELTISDHEMDMILRHGRQPYKGGWQKSIMKIFGRHFDLEV
jgi:hypothetical protein